MIATTEKKRSIKEKIENIPHFLAVLVMFAHSFERYENGHNTFIFFLVAGIIILLLSIFHHRLASRFPFIDIIFYIIESILSFIIAWEYFAAGKKGLPYAYLLAGVIQLAAVFIFMKKNKTEQ